jgi:hypothetical protein
LTSAGVATRPKRKRGTIVAIVSWTVVAIVVVLAVNATRSHDKAGATDPAALASIMAELKPSTPPGYSGVTDGGVAWAWEKDQSTIERVCGALYGEGCDVLKVQAIYGCSSLYAEANLLDSGETVVGYTNGTASHLAAGDVAEVSLMHYGHSANKIRLTQISCY